MFNTETIHIEVSSKCTLRCPRCPRTEFKPEQLNQEISLAEFKNAFDLHTMSSVKIFVFCGDVGDPIYATDFIDIVSYIKTCSDASVYIITNGSYKKVDWWTKLGNVLTNSDLVTFSVDGWDNISNNKYRVNSDWDSIVTGIKTLKKESECRIKWSAIYFSFNEANMDLIEQTARDLGCDEFQAVRSTKFDGRYAINGVDALKPISNVSSSSMYEISTKIIDRPRPIRVLQRKNAHSWAKCLNWQKEMFINVDGLVFPCPWFHSGYQENDFVEKYKDKLSIKTRSLSEVLADPLWDEFVARLETMPLEVCKIKCKGCSE